MGHFPISGVYLQEHLSQCGLNDAEYDDGLKIIVDKKFLLKRFFLIVW